MYSQIVIASVVLIIIRQSASVEIRKCCASGKQVNGAHSEDNTQPLCVPGLSLGAYQTLFRIEFDFKNATHVSLGELNCQGLRKFSLNRSLQDDYFFFNADGSLNYFGINFTTATYCVDLFEENFGAYTCQTSKDNGENVSHPNLIGMTISIPFLFLTFIVYLILNEKSIGRRCQTAYVFCLMCAYISLVLIQSRYLKSDACTTLGAFCFYFFMSSLCWVNISCIDIFWTFSGLRGVQYRPSNQWKRFGCYATYANGLPLLLLAVIFSLNMEQFQNEWYYPAFGKSRCWLGDNIPVLLYFYGPMGFLLVINTTLFVFTALKIRQHQRETQVLRSSESLLNYDRNHQMYRLFFKLIIAMGLNWLLEFVSWCVDTIWRDKQLEQLWIVTDLCNALYGLFIFVLFICKRSIWVLLKQKFQTIVGKPRLFKFTSSHSSEKNIIESENGDIKL